MEYLGRQQRVNDQKQPLASSFRPLAFHAKSLPSPSQFPMNDRNRYQKLVHLKKKKSDDTI